MSIKNVIVAVQPGGQEGVNQQLSNRGGDGRLRVCNVKYLDDVLQNLLVDDSFVARCFMVQINYHLQGALSKGHII